MILFPRNRHFGIVLIAMQSLFLCSCTPAKVHEAAEAINAYTDNHPTTRVGPFESPVIPGALQISIIPGLLGIDNGNDCVLIKLPYSISAIESYDGLETPNNGTNTPQFKIYGPEDTGPMLFAYRDGKLYAASGPARMYAPELEYFELPRDDQ